MFLHVIPRSALCNPCRGTYKDVSARVHWLEVNVRDYRQVVVDEDNPVVANQVLGNNSLEGALVEYTFYPRIVKWLKLRCVRGVVAVRSINAEPLQHWDNYGWTPLRRLPWVLYGMGRLALKEMQCKRCADVILAINEWEQLAYWRWIPGRARVEWLPYCVPEEMIPGSPLPFQERNTIACIPTSQKNRKSWDLVRRFTRFADAMRKAGADYDFVVTGDLAAWGLPQSENVRFTGFIKDLASFLGTCRAVTILSPLGYGFKTTMADAWAAGAHVLAHPRLVQRSPSRARRYLLSLDTDAMDSEVLSSLRGLLSCNPEGAFLHRELAQSQHQLMSQLFGGIVMHE
jgi:hypothetical protein